MDIKTKFDISAELLDDCIDIPHLERLYNKYYKNDGFIFNEFREEVYKIFPYKVDLKIGDLVDLKGLKEVTWKMFDPEKGIFEYVLKEI